ncbi:DUF3939 domain-containing protein [Exiguobacterium sp. SH1S21]|uniref:DUF3939 domain-containing protein n=1 Tax=unclassified Exiguobacterium TaxID=2644629 RepID=UPI0009FEEB2E|nr:MULTISPECIES: DUF3939 domain-containing protein [unclassified Exiguobacterium]TCI56287.1 DUF3939 domain-containing protein [Exiguobacterium sp. SH1S21]TCI72968.1 DUF3939 domain-containing protein [Exiguobacterium sp. SH0S7]
MERQTRSGKNWWQRLTQKEDVVEQEVDITLPQLREAIHEYEQTLPKGVNRTVLLDESQEIDLGRLKRHLPGKPRQRFYMSKETFHIAPEDERDVVYEMDQVQRALDLYFEQEKKLPLRKFQQTAQIDLTRLREGGYLKVLPKRPYYVVDETLIVSLEPKSTE